MFEKYEQAQVTSPVPTPAGQRILNRSSSVQFSKHHGAWREVGETEVTTVQRYRRWVSSYLGTFGLMGCNSYPLV